MKTNKLLIRPRPYEDESLRGYILRVAEANSAPNSIIIFQYLGIKHKHYQNLLFPRDEINLGSFSELVNVTVKKLESLILYNLLFPHMAIEQEEKVRFHIWNHGTSGNEQQVCSICLKEASYQRNLWELSLVTTCPLHSCRLIDRCQDCGKAINPYRKKMSYCNCGFDYRESDIIFAESELSIFLRHTIEKSGPRCGENVLYSLNPRLSIYTIITLVRLVNGLEAKTNHNNFSIGIDKRILTEQLDRTFSIFDKWPESFFAFLDDYRIAKNYSIRFSRLNTFFNTYFCHEDLKFIVDALHDYGYSFWERGFLQQIETNNLGVEIVKESIKATIQRHSRARDLVGISQNKLAKLLGVANYQIDHLREKQIIMPISGPDIDGMPTWLFEENSEKMILDKFKEDITTKIHDDEVLSFLQTSLKFVPYGLKKIDLIQSVLLKKLRPCSIVEGNGFHQFQFNRSDVLSFLKGGMLTREDISKKLSCNYRAAYYLVKYGFIKGEKIGEFTLVSHENYNEFREKFILAIEIVHLYPAFKSTRRLVRKLLQVGISPVDDRYMEVGFLFERSAKLTDFLKKSIARHSIE
ncbi:TniQ family protein [Paenibacillus aurantiacus]|uniref:TniQ family protein n=1 Tax=Paenibacillus aurantiacus TaxID=1936118 RepID=A0ABV5KRI4_9BACL